MVSDGYFNPRSHEGSDDDQAQRTSTTMDFNPRSHEGSDSRIETEVDQIKNFNPRSHEGSDVNQAAKKLYDYISIHAPTRGATGLCKYIVKDPQDFNPRSHEGSDTARKQPERTAGNFNPRSHEGSDGQHFMQLRGREISIHAPTRGATLEAMASMAKVPKISIHAPTRGATIHTRSARLLHRISIHAPTRGATRWQQPSRTFRRFQSTLPRGERPVVASLPDLYNYFNPRSHEGSDVPAATPHNHT